jgi:hypothetical protein
MDELGTSHPNTRRTGCQKEVPQAACLLDSKPCWLPVTA